MLKNYLKIALKVLTRRKFFTLVSLMGITFTIAVLIIAAALIDNFMSPARPGSKFDRTMFVEHIEVKNDKSQISSNPSYRFLDRYVRSMKTPEEVSLHRQASTTSVYLANRKIDLSIKFTDAQFWDILEFDFLDGRPFDSEAVANADMVAVITERTRRQIFGNEQAIGKYIETTEGNFRVVGVIPKEEIPTMLASADIYAPITVHRPSLNNENIYGAHIAFVLARSRDDFSAIKEEFGRSLDQARRDYEGEWTEIDTRIGTSAEEIVAYIVGGDNDSAILAAIGMVIGFMILFMIFPAINLVNLNVTRIIERASEIGVRKSFGASSTTLVGQFLVENIVLTMIGGVAAWVVSWVALWILTGSDLTPYGAFHPSPRLFVECILICLVFGIVSGVYPAYRMSRMQPVEALRGVES